MSTHRGILLLSLFLTHADAGAATFCVGDGASMQIALETAAASPEPDVVRVLDTDSCLIP
jgi:hypothetical protein